MKFFDADGPLMQGLSKMADLMILDLIALVCCIPIVTIIRFLNNIVSLII